MRQHHEHDGTRSDPLTVIGIENDNTAVVARRRIEPIDPATRTRLRRVTATMVSGPDVLRAPSRWRAFFLREDRGRFGDSGPARRRFHAAHVAGALIGIVAMLAIAGVR